LSHAKVIETNDVASGDLVPNNPAKKRHKIQNKDWVLIKKNFLC